MMGADLYVLRHGTSLANEANLIVSALDNGVLPQYGLAPTGREQAADAGRKLAATLLSAARAEGAATPPPPLSVHFYASPFSRTLETAALAAAAFEEASAASSSPPAVSSSRLAGPPVPEPALRERFFGSALELRHHEGYSTAWEGDARDPRQRPPGHGDGESVADVAARAAELLGRLAERHGGGGSRSGGEEAAALAAASAASAAASTEAAAADAVVVLVSHGDTLSILQAAATGAPLREHRTFGLGTAELRRVGPLGEAARRAALSAVAAAAAVATTGAERERAPVVAAGS